MDKTTINRPSQAILDSGLDFVRFKEPFAVFSPSGRPVGGFVSVADALDYAIRKHRRGGGAHTVADADGETVYIVE